MTQEDKIHQLRAMLTYIDMRVGEFYNKGLYNNNPTRKELYFILKDIKKTLETTKNNWLF